MKYLMSIVTMMVCLLFSMKGKGQSDSGENTDKKESASQIIRRYYHRGGDIRRRAVYSAQHSG